MADGSADITDISSRTRPLAVLVRTSDVRHSLTGTRWLRPAALTGGVVAMAVSLFAVSAALGVPTTPIPPAVHSPAPVVDPLTRAITGLQAQLKRSPDSDRGWSDLGLAYVQQA